MAAAFLFAAIPLSLFFFVSCFTRLWEVSMHPWLKLVSIYLWCLFYASGLLLFVHFAEKG